MRVIFNTSFIVNEDISIEWVKFMRENYIKEIVATNMCNDFIFTRVSIDQPEGKTYSLQLVFQSQELLNHFQEIYLPKIETPLIQKYNNRYLCFSSILTEIE